MRCSTTHHPEVEPATSPTLTGPRPRLCDFVNDHVNFSPPARPKIYAQTSPKQSARATLPTSPGLAQEEVTLVSSSQPNGGVAVVPGDPEAPDPVASFSTAEHLVEAARELLDDAAATVPDQDIAGALRACLSSTVDPILREVEAAAAHARAEQS